MPRLLFEKMGTSIWMSHLDLMRLFQRSFKRAGLQLSHTNGYNPRPSVSIALPLSVGVESHCELLDFDLVGEFLICTNEQSNTVTVFRLHIGEDGFSAVMCAEICDVPSPLCVMACSVC